MDLAVVCSEQDTQLKKHKGFISILSLCFFKTTVGSLQKTEFTEICVWRRNSSPIVCITIHEPTFFFYLTRFHDLRWPQTQQCVVDENLVSGVHLYLWEHDNKLSLLLNYPSHCHTSFPQTVWRNLVKVETASFSVYTPLLSQHLIRFCVCPLSVTLFEGRRERELDSISCQCLPACLTNYSCLYSFFRLRSSVSPSLSLTIGTCGSSVRRAPLKDSMTETNLAFSTGGTQYLITKRRGTSIGFYCFCLLLCFSSMPRLSLVTIDALTKMSLRSSISHERSANIFFLIWLIPQTYSKYGGC